MTGIELDELSEEYEELQILEENAERHAAEDEAHDMELEKRLEVDVEAFSKRVDELDQLLY